RLAFAERFRRCVAHGARAFPSHVYTAALRGGARDRVDAAAEGDRAGSAGEIAMQTAPGTGKYERLLARCEGLAPVPTAVAHPCESTALSGAVEAASRGLIVPLLVGPAAKIAETAAEAKLDISNLEIVAAPHNHASATKAVELVKQSKAEIMMKGSLHTDELMSAIVSREGGLRTGRRISHVFIMDVPTYHKVLIVSDAAINIAPALEDKVDIVQN